MLKLLISALSQHPRFFNNAIRITLLSGFEKKDVYELFESASDPKSRRERVTANALQLRRKTARIKEELKHFEASEQFQLKMRTA